MEDTRKRVIKNYVASYNSFDVDGMLRDMDGDIIFENISNGQRDLRLEGLEAFRKQAQSAIEYFKEREQKITSWHFQENGVIVNISFKGILKTELPNGLKPGDVLHIKGQSTFMFKGNRIIEVIDES